MPLVLNASSFSDIVIVDEIIPIPVAVSGNISIVSVETNNTTSVTIHANTGIDPSPNTGIGYFSQCFYNDSPILGTGSYYPGGGYITITPADLQVQPVHIGTTLKMMFYSNQTYRLASSNTTIYPLPNAFLHPGGSSNIYGGLQTSVDFIVQPCNAPILTATPSNAQVSLSWTAPDDGGSPITSYNLQILNSPGGGTVVLNVPSTPTSRIVTGLTNNVTYYFNVSGVNGYCTGDGPPSGPLSNTETATPAPIAPDAPTSLTAQSGVKSVSLTWLLPLSDGGTAITSYTVQCRVRGTATWFTATTIPTPILLTPVPLHCIVTECDSIALLDGTLYDFRVAAVNAVSVGAYASIIESTDSLPDAPISLTGTPGNAQVTLYWTVTTPMTNYLVEFKLDTSVAWSTFSHAPSAEITIVVTGLTNGSLYDFRVSAINVVGTGPPSNIFKATPNLISTLLQYNSCGIKGAVACPPRLSRAGGNNCPNCASNYGELACGTDVKSYSTYALDERRKVEILKYKKNSAQLSKAQQYSMMSRNALTRKKSWATQTQTYTDPNVDKLPEIQNAGVTVALKCNQPIVPCSLTSDCDVPGPVILLCIDESVPLYNYKMQVTYATGGKEGITGLPIVCGYEGFEPTLPPPPPPTFTTTNSQNAETGWYEFGGSFGTAKMTPTFDSGYTSANITTTYGYGLPNFSNVISGTTYETDDNYPLITTPPAGPIPYTLEVIYGSIPYTVTLNFEYVLL